MAVAFASAVVVAFVMAMAGAGAVPCDIFGTLGFPQSGFLNLPPPGQFYSVHTGLQDPAPL